MCVLQVFVRQNVGRIIFRCQFHQLRVPHWLEWAFRLTDLIVANHCFGQYRLIKSVFSLLLKAISAQFDC